MSRLHSLALSAVLVSAMVAATPAHALAWNESPPGAGETLATAQTIDGVAGTTLTDIFGTLETVTLVNATPRNQVDLYRIFIDDVSTFSATTLSGNPDDTALFLFDSAGFGIYSNDDNGFDLLSTLPVGGPTVPGIYYLGVSVGGFVARDLFGTGLFLSGSFTDVVGADPAAGGLSYWDEGFATLNEGGLAYDIALTGVSVVAVPEPSELLLLLAGLGAVAARLRRRRARDRTALS
ncbi:MAG: PEP-CTERM sorting domain-containing protein [Caldimonas sp.]